MGVFSDTYDEFKKAGPKEKVVIVGASVAALGIALYLHKKSASTSATDGTSGLPSNFQQGAPGGGGAGSTGSATPSPSSSPAPKPAPRPISPVRPIIKQPTTVTKTAAGTTHRPSAPPPKKTTAPIYRPAPKIYMQHQAPNYTYNRNSTYEVARGRATYGTPSAPKPVPDSQYVHPIHGPF